MTAQLPAGGLALQEPWFLLLLCLLPLAFWLRARRGEPSVTFAPAPLLGLGDHDTKEPLPRGLRARLRHLPLVLHALGLLLAIVALSRPVHRTPLPRQAEGIDILLCLDVSSSMGATDLDRSRTRLEVVRQAALAFVQGRPEDRIGLLTFARYPDLRCPPTLDHQALAEFLRLVQMVPADGAEDATGIGTAAARAAQILQSAPGRSRIAILLSDGSENVASAQAPDEIAPLHAAQLCQQLGLRVYTITAGDGPEPAELKELASRTGGRSFQARDSGAVQQVYAAIDRLEKTALAEERHLTDERFLPFLLLGIALVVLGRLLGASVLGVGP